MIKAAAILTSHNKFHITLGLDRIKKILSLLDNPQDKYKIIHIAGTNGKGSVSKIINDILINSGKKTGLFTSPHLFKYEERIKINNTDIQDDIFNRLINEIDCIALKNNIELSEFELLTAVAFYWFYLKSVEYVVLEVGLGGLYDATNVVKKPLISIITTIDFDHTERLGNSIDKIAFQKAGIIKNNSIVVISDDNLGFDIIKKYAENKNSKLIKAEKIKTIFEKNGNYAIIDSKKYEFSLLGAHQAKNLALALSAIKNIDFKVENEVIKTTLKNVHWKFRLEYIKEKNLLIDGAHNPSGINALRKFLDENFADTKKTFIFGCLKNKDYKKMLNILIKPEDKFYFYEFNYPNALKYDDIEEIYNAKKISDIEEIKAIINKDKNLKIFCGSLYMLGLTFKNINLEFDYSNAG